MANGRGFSPLAGADANPRKRWLAVPAWETAARSIGGSDIGAGGSSIGAGRGSRCCGGLPRRASVSLAVLPSAPPCCCRPSPAF